VAGGFGQFFSNYVVIVAVAVVEFRRGGSEQFVTF
jgi:hypothetical protein